jgi:hypothetical protein
VCIVRCCTAESIIGTLRLNPLSNSIYKTFMFSLIVIHGVLVKLIPRKYALSSLRLQINFKASIPHMILSVVYLLELQFISGKEVITVHISYLLLCLPKYLCLISDFSLQVLNLLHSLDFGLFSH